LQSAAALRYHLENGVCKSPEPRLEHREGHHSPTCPPLQRKRKRIANALEQAKSNSSFDCDICGKPLQSAAALRYHLENGVCKSLEPRLEHRHLEHVSCLEALEETKFVKNIRPALKSHRQQARTPRKDLAITLGVVKAMGRGIRASKMTRSHEGLAKNICSLIRHRRPNFPFTSVQVNKNSTSKLHVDSSNAGPSLIHGLGDYHGGELYVDKRGLLDVRNKWVEFDGNIPHFTNVFTGRRYTLIFFVHQSYALLPATDRGYLENLGFNFPKDVMIKGEYATRQVRIDEARKRVPKELQYAMGPKRTLHKRRRVKQPT